MSLSKYIEEQEQNDLSQAVIDFLKDNPNPSDSKLHSWAENNEYDIHKVEAEMYKLATLYVQGIE